MSLRASIGKWFFNVVLISAFFIVSVTVTIYSYGYRYDPRMGSLVKTSIIDLNSSLENVRLYLDGEFITSEAPFQIDGVSVGFHNVRIEKDGFYNWEKKLKVSGDIVTRISSVLLLPLSVNDYLIEISEVFGDYYFSNGLFVTFDNNLHFVKFVKFLSYGKDYDTVIKDNLENDILNIQFVSDDYVVLYFSDSSVSIFDTNRFSEIASFALPEGKLYHFDIDNRKFYYLDSDILKVASFSLDGELKNRIIFLGADFFKFASDQFYIVRNGVLGSSDLNGKSWKSLYRLSESFSTVQIDDFFLVNEDRLLHFGENDLLAEVDRGVKGFSGFVYYKSHEIRYYNPVTLKSELITRFSGEIEKVDFLGPSHVVFILDGDLWICEMDGDNCHEIISSKEISDFFIVSERNLAVVVAGKLYLLELGKL